MPSRYRPVLSSASARASSTRAASTRVRAAASPGGATRARSCRRSAQGETPRSQAGLAALAARGADGPSPDDGGRGEEQKRGARRSPAQAAVRIGGERRQERLHAGPATGRIGLEFLQQGPPEEAGDPRAVGRLGD